MMKIRVGVVGCGLVAQIAHLPYLQELSHLFEISALCDISPSLVDQLCQRYNVPGRYVDYRKLVEHDLDAVFVLTRDHAPVAIAAAERGKHVFVEKPMCFNLEQADEMINCARQHGVKLMVGYMKRYDPGFERAQELFQQMEGGGLIRVHNSVGSPSRITQEMYDLVCTLDVPEGKLAGAKAREVASFLQAIGREKEEFLTAYSLLLHLWSHDINLLRGAFGEPHQVRYAEVRVGTPTTPLPALQVLAVLDYGPDVACMWETRAFAGNEWWDEELALFGNERTVRVRFPFPYLKNAPTIVRVEETIGGALIEQEIVASYDEAYKRELKHFYDCVANDMEPRTDGEDGKKDLEFALHIIHRCAPIADSSD
jgi:predicted dehydrogenase